MLDKSIESISEAHPGTLLRDEFHTYVPNGLNIATAAMMMHISVNEASDIFMGKAPITSQIAVNLQRNLRMNGFFWKHLQLRYDRRHADAS